MLGGDPAHLLDYDRQAQLEAAAASRVGLSVAVGNDEFERKAQEEARGAEDILEKLRSQARAQAACCAGQLDVAAKAARAEEEKQALSERVGRELDAFRQELRQRDAEEEDRLGHLYRGLLGQRPQPSQRSAFFVADGGGASMHWSRGDGTCAFPTIIASSSRLVAGPVEDGWSSRPSVPPRADLRVRALEHELQPPVRARRSVPHPKLSPDPGPSEAHKLLNRNLARLERLQGLGF